MIEKSDKIICDNWSYSQFKHKQENDPLFVYRFMQPQPFEIRDIDLETTFLDTQYLPKKLTCTVGTRTRGNNATCGNSNGVIPCEDFDKYTKYNMADWLLIPCKKNTFRNWVKCDCFKCCSYHQMFDNITKRKGDSFPVLY